MFNKKEEVQYSKVTTLVDKDCSIEGLIRSQGTVRIDGSLKGDIFVEGNLFIGETGKVIGNIHATNLLVAGSIQGNVRAIEQLRVTSEGSLYGDIHTKTFILDENATFEGNCKMDREKLDKNTTATLE